MTARSPKQIGTEGETAVLKVLLPYFPGAHRQALVGSEDTGDIGGITDLCVQVKTVRAPRLGEWIDATTKQAERKGVPYYIVVHKRSGRGIERAGDWYVTLPLKVFAPLFARLTSSRLEAG